MTEIKILDVKLTKEEMMLLLHALATAQFPRDVENDVYKLHTKLKEIIYIN